MTREEKLEEAKRLYQTANADQRYILESLFPELAEQEDEKIKKKLLKLFNDMGWDDSILYDYNLDKNKTIAWLEKQAPKPKWSDDELLMVITWFSQINQLATDLTTCNNHRFRNAHECIQEIIIVTKKSIDYLNKRMEELQ